MEPTPRRPILVSWQALTLLSLKLFLLVELFPLMGIALSGSILLALEALITLLLYGAWRQRTDLFSYGILYALMAVFLFRVLYQFSFGTQAMWAFRVQEQHTIVLGLLWYLFGGIMAHAHMYDRLMQQWERLQSMPRTNAWMVTGGVIGGTALLFILFQSNLISRDGLDWIQRTREPVWHLYLREPLTIGLYRLLYVCTQPLLGWNSIQLLAAVSVACGVWSAFWLVRLCREVFPPTMRLPAVLLAVSSGGWMMLYFGHIEVYPVLIAGWLPLLFSAYRYASTGTGGVAVVIWLAVSFLLHLSTGWLFPAVGLLPFLAHPFRRALRDAAIGVGLFGAIQVVCWGALIGLHYEASLALFLDRLHETFHVGPDGAMFLPGEVWLHGGRMLLWLNEYIYLSAPLLVLVPVAVGLHLLYRTPYGLFTLIAFASYFIYTFLWNPDRGFPEDWDLFSPLVPLAWLMVCSTFAVEPVRRLSWWVPSIWIVAWGTLPFAISQIWFHHSS